MSWFATGWSDDGAGEYPGGRIVVDSAGEVLRVSLGRGDADCRPYYEASPGDWIAKALVASEDSTFWTHCGVRPASILRAAWQNVTSRRRIPEARAVGRATLRGWKLVEQLYADTERSRGSRVEGVLYLGIMCHRWGPWWTPAKTERIGNDNERRKLGRRNRLVEAHLCGGNSPLWVVATHREATKPRGASAERADLLRVHKDVGDTRHRRGAETDGGGQGRRGAQASAVERDSGPGRKALRMLRGADGRGGLYADGA